MYLEYMIWLIFCTVTLIVFVCNFILCWLLWANKKSSEANWPTSSPGIHEVVLLIPFLVVIIVESFGESKESRPALYLCVGQQWSVYWTGRGNQHLFKVAWNDQSDIEMVCSEKYLQAQMYVHRHVQYI